MPIDVERVLAAEIPVDTYSWTDDDIILYNLAVGAGNPPTDPVELSYTFESDLRAVPSFGTIPPFGLFMGTMLNLDGLDINLMQVLHGEQGLTLHAAIPTSGTVNNRARVLGVYDKGKGALIEVEVVSTLVGEDNPLFTNRSSIFVRGEGGFGSTGRG